MCLSLEREKKTTLRVDIIDDGKGLPAGLQAGVGLMSMRERAIELGGEWSIGAANGGGTHVTATLPLVGLED